MAASSELYQSYLSEIAAGSDDDTNLESLETPPKGPLLSPFSPLFTSKNGGSIQWKQEQDNNVISLEHARRISIVVHIRKSNQNTCCVIGDQNNTKDLIIVNPSSLDGSCCDISITFEAARRLVASGTEDWARIYRFNQVIWEQEQFLFLKAFATDLPKGNARTVISIGASAAKICSVFGNIAQKSSAFRTSFSTESEIQDSYGMIGTLFYYLQGLFTFSLSIFEIEDENLLVDLLASKPFQRESQPQIKYGKENCARVVGLVEQDVLTIADLGTTLRKAFAVANHPKRASLPGHTVAYLHLKKNGKHISTASFFNVASPAMESTSSERRNISMRRSFGALGNILRGTLLRDAGMHASTPFRDSTLTKILQGPVEDPNSRLIVMASINADKDEYEESLSTLRYASRLVQKPGQAPQSPFDNASKATSPTSLGSLENTASVNLEDFAGNEKLLKLMLADPRQRLAKIVRPSHKSGNDDSRKMTRTDSNLERTTYGDPSIIGEKFDQGEITIPNLDVEQYRGNAEVPLHPYEGMIDTPLATNTSRQEHNRTGLLGVSQQKAFITSLDDTDILPEDDEPRSLPENSFRLDVMEQGDTYDHEEPSPLTIDTYEQAFHYHSTDTGFHERPALHTSKEKLLGWSEDIEDATGLDASSQNSVNEVERPPRTTEEQHLDDLSAELRERTEKMYSTQSTSHSFPPRDEFQGIKTEDHLHEFLDADQGFDPAGIPRNASSRSENVSASSAVSHEVQQKLSNLEQEMEQKEKSFQEDLARHQRQIEFLEKRNQRVLDEREQVMKMAEDAVAANAGMQRSRGDELRSFQKQQEEQMEILNEERKALNEQLLALKREMHEREEKHLYEVANRDEEAHRLATQIRREEQELRRKERIESYEREKEQIRLALEEEARKAKDEREKEQIRLALEEEARKAKDEREKEQICLALEEETRKAREESRRMTYANNVGPERLLSKVNSQTDESRGTTQRSKAENNQASDARPLKVLPKTQTSAFTKVAVEPKAAKPAEHVTIPEAKSSTSYQVSEEQNREEIQLKESHRQTGNDFRPDPDNDASNSHRSSKYPLPPAPAKNESARASESHRNAPTDRDVTDIRIPPTDDYEGVVEELNARLQKLSADRDEAFRIAEEAIATQSELEERLAHLHSEKQSLAQSTRSQGEAVELKKQIAKLRAEVKDREMTVLELQATNSSLEKECQYLSQSKGAEDQHILDLKRQLGVAQNAARESMILRDELNRARQELEHVSKEKNKYDREYRDRLGKKDRGLQQMEERLRFAEEELRIAKSRNRYEHDDLKKELNETKENVMRLEEESSKLLGRLRSKERELTVMSEENDELVNEVQTLRALLAQKDDELLLLNQNFAAKVQENESQKQEIEKIKKALKDFQKETRLRVQKVVAHREEAAALLQQTLEENTALRDRNSELEAALAQAKRPRGRGSSNQYQSRHPIDSRDIQYEDIGMNDEPRQLAAYLASKLEAASSSTRNIDLVYALEDEKDAEIQALKQRIRRLERRYGGT